MPREIPQKKQKMAGILKTGKSYADLNLAASAGNLNGGQGDSTPQSASFLGSLRSHSFGANRPHASLSRLALGDGYPHDADAYELLMKCGHGATSDVHRARCKPLGEIVAVKIVNLESAGQNLDTIIHEAQLLCGLRHKHVLPLLACFIKEDSLWMVLPYIQGGSVESAMKYAFPKGLSERLIAPIMLCVLQALIYLHKHDVVHRDVKASNILLDRDNVLLGDFGIAAEMERNLEADKETFGRYLCRKTFVGTPVWMAPEIIEQGESGHGTKVDIYSFGMTLLEMARGKAPFAGMPFDVVAMNKVHHPSPCLPATYEGRTYSPDMQEVVAACLEKEPARRPTAAQLLKYRFFKWVPPPKLALEELLAGVPNPVQRLSSLTRRSNENLDRLAVDADGGDSVLYGADERVSFNSAKVKDVQAATRFDAKAALSLLRRMLQSSISPADGACPPEGHSPSEAATSQGGSTPNLMASFTQRVRRPSFGKKDSSQLWPSLPPASLKHCKGILFASAGRRGFGLQTSWGHGFMLAHCSLGEGKSYWSGPCYCYISGNLHVGMGDVTRESIILFSGDTYKSRVKGGVPVKLGEMKLVDAVEEGLGLDGIVKILDDESSPCLGVAFRHFTGTRSWKSGNMHLDHAANEKVYGRPVSAEAILEGNVPPPPSFRALIDELKAGEEGRYERYRSSDGDSDTSSRGLGHGLERDASLASNFSMQRGGSPASTPRAPDDGTPEAFSPRGRLATANAGDSTELASLPEEVEPQREGGLSSFQAAPPAPNANLRGSISAPITASSNLPTLQAWMAERSDEDDGTPPPEGMLQGDFSPSELSYIRTGHNPASPLTQPETPGGQEGPSPPIAYDSSQQPYLQPERSASSFEFGVVSPFSVSEAQAVAVHDPFGSGGSSTGLVQRPSGPPISPASSKGGGNTWKPPKCPPRQQSVASDLGAVNTQ